MLFKSALMTAGSGKIRGIVASHNRGGAYLRGLTIPTNPNTAQQQVVRNSLKALVAAWQNTLTSLQRTSWQTYADNVQVRNALGDLITLTGQNMYVRSNVPRLQAGMSRIDTAPVTFDLGSFTAPTITLANGGTAGTVTYTASDDWVGTANTVTGMLIYCSRQQAPSINFFKGPYRFAAVVNGTSGSATFTNPFTNATRPNQTAIQIIVSRSDGRLSSPFNTTVSP